MSKCHKTFANRLPSVRSFFHQVLQIPVRQSFLAHSVYKTDMCRRWAAMPCRNRSRVVAHFYWKPSSDHNATLIPWLSVWAIITRPGLLSIWVTTGRSWGSISRSYISPVKACYICLNNTATFAFSIALRVHFRCFFRDNLLQSVWSATYTTLMLFMCRVV